MSKHTPGPWRYLGRVSISDGVDWPTVECGFKRFIQPEGRDQDECEANAHLIAAAPDLLEAAKIQQQCGKPLQVNMYDEDGCEGWIWSHPDGREWVEIGDWDEQPPLHPLMVAAITKAEAKEEAKEEINKMNETWTVDEEGDVVNELSGDLIACILDHTLPPTVRRLIAAAPDMQKLLQNILSSINDDTDGRWVYGFTDEIIALLAKIKGDEV